MESQRPTRNHISKKEASGGAKIYRAMDREDTYRLVDDGDSLTRGGDHVANDGSTKTEEEVSESNGAITITGNNE
jgi:hypothetical protein